MYIEIRLPPGENRCVFGLHKAIGHAEGHRINIDICVYRHTLIYNTRHTHIYLSIYKIYIHTDL